MKYGREMVLVGVMMVAATTVATRIVDVDGKTMSLAGETHTVEANDLGGFPDIDKNKYESLTEADGHITADILSKPARTDFYFKWSSGVSLPSASYRYGEIHYQVNPTSAGGFVGDSESNRLRLQTTNDAEAWDDFSNPETIPGSVGPHSFIIDLHANRTYTGHWNALRWDFFNDVRNAGKSITIEKIVFAREITPISDTAVGLILW